MYLLAVFHPGSSTRSGESHKAGIVIASTSLLRLIQVLGTQHSIRAFDSSVKYIAV